MALTKLQRRALSRNRQANIIAKVTMPDTSYFYLTSYKGPFTDLDLADAPVNPVIVSLTGLYVTDTKRVSDCQMTLYNKKLNHQTGNPLLEAVHFSDLIADDLGLATIEIKELIQNAQPVTVSAWNSTDLQTIFVGQIRRPFRYQDDTMTIGLTYQEDTSDLEFPLERLGEEAGEDPRQEHKPIPILFGDCTTEILAQRDMGGDMGTIYATEPPSVGIGRPYDVAKSRIILSSRAIEEIQFVTLQTGGWPSAPILPADWESYADPDHGDYEIVEFLVRNRIRCTPMVRLNAQARGDPTYDHKDVGNEATQVNLASGESVAVATPVISGTGSTLMLSLFVFVWVDMPEGGELKMDMGYQEREGTIFHSRYHGVLTAGNMHGEGHLTHHSDWADFRWWLHENHGFPLTFWSHDWGFFGNTGALRIVLTRQDTGTDDMIVKGIYAIPLISYFGLEDDIDGTDATYGCAGKGIPAPADSAPYHPSRIIKEAMTDLMEKDAADVHWGGPADFTGTESWKFGFSLHDPMKMQDILRELTRQSSTRLYREADGRYMLRLMSRQGGLPTHQRYVRSLRYGMEVTDVPKIEPLGRDYVKNIIIVDYQQNEDGSYRRTAWVRGNDSDDGYGFRDTAAESVSTTSIAKYKERRLEIQAWAIRDKVTACGFRNYLLSRHCMEPTRITFPMGSIGADFDPAEEITFDATTIDPVILFNGASWDGQYFEIEDIRRSGDDYIVTALTVPGGVIPQVIMIPRRFMVVP